MDKVTFKTYDTDGVLLSDELTAQVWPVAPLRDDEDDSEPGLNISLDGIVSPFTGETLTVEVVIPERTLISALARLEELRRVEGRY